MGPLCIICTESLGYKGVSATCCGHVYHETCLQKWLLRAGSCPQCRKPVSHTNLIRKLFFSVEESEEPNGRERNQRSGSSEDVNRLQEWLQTERQLVEELQKRVGEEQAKHRVTRLFCIELKEAFRTTKKKELQGMTYLQKEIKELRLSLSPRKDDVSHTVWKQLGSVNNTLDSLKQREARNTDYFLRRIWRLMAEIKSRTLEAKEMERSAHKIKGQMAEQQRLMRLERKRLTAEVGMVQEQLTEMRTEMQNRERQVAELAAENATLTILLAFEKERSRSARQDGENGGGTPTMNPPSAAIVIREWSMWSWMDRIGLLGLVDRIQTFLHAGTTRFNDDVFFPPELMSYRCFVDHYNVQRTALYTTVSVLSYYMASWLGLHPVVVLIATGIATGAMNPNGQNWNSSP